MINEIKIHNSTFPQLFRALFEKKILHKRPCSLTHLLQLRMSLGVTTVLYTVYDCSVALICPGQNLTGLGLKPCCNHKEIRSFSKSLKIVQLGSY